MGLRKKTPITFKPVGVTDAIDGTNAPRGSLAIMQNLLPAPSTKNAVVPRPAAIKVVDFVAGGFNTPTRITALKVVGSFAYGMVSTARNAGKDEPFVYNLLTSAFVTVTGVTNANTPSTQLTTGDWVPPTISLVANKVIITHPGFPGTVGAFFGVIDISNPAVPAWSSANTATNLLTAVPTCAALFNGRIYYAVNNTVVFSDALVPLTVTNASQAITLGDNVGVTALAGNPLANPIQGGQIQSLFAFKGEHTIFQITGDPATNNLASNQLNVQTGTLSPAAVVATPRGLIFISPEGARLIDDQGNIGDPIGAYGQGIAVPFQNQLNPSRTVGAYNDDTLRVSVTNGAKSGSPQEEYWYNFSLDAWSGPHTGTSYVIDDVNLGTGGWLFGMTGVNAALFQGGAFPILTSTFVENGVALTWIYQTCLLPDNEQAAMNTVQEGSVAMNPGSGQQITIQAIDEQQNIMDTISIVTPAGTSAQWGSFTWGSVLWGATAANIFRQYRLAWHNPLVFKQMSVRLVGSSLANMIIGNLYMAYQILGYDLPGTY